MSEFMLIIPASDQPLWALKKELEDLGGVRRQDFSPVPTQAGRYGYQVTPELYKAWQEAAGVERAEEAAADPIEADGNTEAAPEAPAGDGAPDPADGNTEVPAGDDAASNADAAAATEQDGAPEPAQGDTQSRKSTKRTRAEQQGKG
jgi:hypothetical protein